LEGLPLAVVDERVERQGRIVYREVPPDPKAVEKAARDGLRAKIRCGGKKIPLSWPELAIFIDSCRSNGVIFKATAGLHHAFTASDESEFGFVNLLAACVFAGHESGVLLTSEIRLDERGLHASGVFARDEDLFADGETCARVRRELFASIGSCSFAEPIGELKALGIL